MITAEVESEPLTGYIRALLLNRAAEYITERLMQEVSSGVIFHDLFTLVRETSFEFLLTAGAR